MIPLESVVVSVVVVLVTLPIFSVRTCRRVVVLEAEVVMRSESLAAAALEDGSEFERNTTL